MAKRNPQLKLLKNEQSAYGGDLLKTRKGRSRGRPLDTRNTMHLVLRSSLAKGDWSFKKPKNEVKVQEIISKFSDKYAVRIVSLANVGNHLHIQFKLGNRNTYKPFIRAVTASIAMAITGINRWTRQTSERIKFWDYRPFTRVVQSLRAILNLRDYMRINELEGYGYRRDEARFFVKNFKWNATKGRQVFTS